MKEKYSITQTLSVEAKPELVFGVLTEIERWPAWTGSVKKIETADVFPFGFGSRVKIFQPRLKPAVWTVTGFDPGRSFTWENKSFGCVVKAEHTVEHGETGAFVKLTTTFEGMMAPLYYRLSAGLVEKYMTMEIEGLKKESEKQQIRQESGIAENLPRFLTT